MQTKIMFLYFQIMYIYAPYRIPWRWLGGLPCSLASTVPSARGSAVCAAPRDGRLHSQAATWLVARLVQFVTCTPPHAAPFIVILSKGNQTIQFPMPGSRGSIDGISVRVNWGTAPPTLCCARTARRATPFFSAVREETTGRKKGRHFSC